MVPAVAALSRRQIALAAVVLVAFAATVPFDLRVVAIPPLLLAAAVGLIRLRSAMFVFLFYLAFQRVLIQVSPPSIARVFRWSDELMAVVGLVYAALQSQGRRRPGTLLLSYATLPIALFMFTGVLSALVNGNPLLQSLLGIHDLVKNFLWFYLFRAFARSREETDVWLERLWWLAIAVALVGVAQEIVREPLTHAMGYEPLGKRWGLMRVPSTLGHPSNLANYLALFLFAALVAPIERVTNMKPRPLVAMALFGGTILLTFSRQVFGSVIVAFVGLRLWWHGELLGKWTTRLLGLALALGLALSVANMMSSDSSFSLMPPTGADPSRGKGNYYVRWAWIARAGDIFLDHPVLGVGPGMFGGNVSIMFDSPVYNRYNWRWFGMKGMSTIDTYWPQVYCETGAIGLVFYIWILVAFLAALKQAYRRARENDEPRAAMWATALGMQLLSVALNAFVAPTFNVAPVTCTLMAMSGLVCGTMELPRPELQKPAGTW